MSIINKISQYRLISITLGNFRFNPGIISTIVTISLLYIMISLGFWQIKRADFKEDLQQQIEDRKNLSPTGLDSLPSAIEQRRYLPVKFKAKFDSEHSFLLDNKTLNGRVGYHLFTPARLSDSKAILVARGFIGMGANRQQLPDIDTPSGKIDMVGLLDNEPTRALVLAENVQQTDRWPVVLQYVDLQEIRKLVDYDIYDMVLWLGPDSPGLYQYDLPVLNLNSAKNSGYAFQWFAMSLVLFIIYIVVNVKQNVSRN